MKPCDLLKSLCLDEVPLQELIKSFIVKIFTGSFKKASKNTKSFQQDNLKMYVREENVEVVKLV